MWRNVTVTRIMRTVIRLGMLTCLILLHCRPQGRGTPGPPPTPPDFLAVTGPESSEPELGGSCWTAGAWLLITV